jgi:transcriptional regulator with XRE-family HTH domain
MDGRIPVCSFRQSSAPAGDYVHCVVQLSPDHPGEMDQCRCKAMALQKGSIMTQRFGQALRAVRLGWQLTLREVEERSRILSREKGSRSTEVSASWLSRMESDEHELTISKLVVLADIFAVAPEQLLKLATATNALSSSVRQASNPAKRLGQENNLGATVAPSDLGQRVERTLLLPTSCPVRSRYIRAIIGAADRTLEPMIPAGSMVTVDTYTRVILPRQNWKNEFQRPIYLLQSTDKYICGWCELSKDGGWLTLIPHPLSRASSQRWKYPETIQSLGRIVGAAIRFA